jgi:hypothetical protein
LVEVGTHAFSSFRARESKAKLRAREREEKRAGKNESVEHERKKT